jgi:RecA/RadA recombinase
MAARKKASSKKRVGKKADKKEPAKKAPSKPISRAAQGPSLAMTKGPALPIQTDAERRRALGALQTKLEGKLIPANRLENVYTLRRPTGIVELDVALGGGFPAGGACMLSGPYNSGKSWLLFRTMAMQQQLYGDSFMGALHVAETQLPYDQMLQAGMRIEVPDSVIRQWIQRDLELGLPMWDNERIAFYKQQVGTLHIIEGGIGEQVLQTVLECVKTNVFSVIGVDSVSSLEPQRDADKDMDEEQARAARAIMMGKFWTKYVPHVNKGVNTTTLLFTQQVRANDSQYGKEWKITGGKASEHYKLIDLAMWAGKQLTRQIQGRNHTVGKQTFFETIKGKAGTHDHIKGEFAFYYSEFFPGNVDVHGDLIVFARQQGILMQTNKGMQLLNAITREPVDGMYAPTEEALKECLQMDFDFELDFRRHVMAAAGLKCLYR